MSNRLTFSLASLILLIAFGLVFVPASVMAHPNVDGGTDHAKDGHMHPTIMVKVDDADTRSPSTIEVVRKPTDLTATPQITDLMIVFDVMLELDPAVDLLQDDGSAIAAGAFDGSSIVGSIPYNNKNGAVPGATAAPTVGATYTGSGKMWTTTVTITLTDDSDAATTDIQQREAAIEAGINVDLHAIAGLIEANVITGPYSDNVTAPTSPTPYHNLQSESVKVTVLILVDDEAPVLTATPAEPADDGSVTVELMFDEMLKDDPTVVATATVNADDATDTTDYSGTYEVSAVTEKTGADNTYEVTVTPNAATQAMPMIPDLEVTLTVSAMDDDDNSITTDNTVVVELDARTYMDETDPMVSILPNPDRQGEAFDISFTATDNYSDTADLTVAVAITPATAVTEAEPMAMAQPDGSYMVTVTPVAATAEMMSIPASTITVMVTATDEADNSGNASEFFFLAARTYTPPPDTTAPMLTATVGAADATTGAVIVTLAFDEALSAAPTVTHAAMPTALTGTYTVSAVTAAPAPAMNTYMVTVTPSALMIGDADLAAGTVTLTVSAMDAAGNSLAAPGNTATVSLAARMAPKDVTAPTFTHNAPTTGVSASTVVNLTFSEAVSDVGVTGTPSMDDAQYTTVVAGSGMAWTVTITPTPRTALAEDMGQRIISFAVSGADAAGNDVDGSFSLILAPRIAGVTPPPTPGNKAPVFAGGVSIMPVTGTAGMAITPVTLPAASDADGDTVTYRVLQALPTGLNFNRVTRYLSGTPAAASSGTYTYVASDGNGGTAALSFQITVSARVTPPASGDLAATYAADVTTIASGMIAANGFATIGSASLPDLEEFFEIGGTIGLSNGDATDDKNSRTVVISEILWGLDYGAPATEQTQWQFIELYNTTGAAINLAGWTLTYTGGNVLPASDIDQMSNRGRTGWDVDSGDTGKSGRVTGTLATDVTSAITPVNIKSMYRNIDYAKVEKTDHDADATKNRNKQLEGVPGGNAKGSWKTSLRRSAYNRWIYDSKRAPHFKSVGILSPSAVAGTPFRINEIGNDTGSDNDWVELHNVTDAEASLKNYQLTAVTAKGTDTELHDFKDQDWKVPAKGFVVISTRHPRDTDLAAGKDISISDDQEENKGASHLFVKKSVNLPDDGKFALILRNNHEKEKTDAHLIDVVATRQGSFADNNIATSLWPLKATNQPHGNVIDGGDEVFKAGLVYQRNSGNGRGEKNFAVRGFTSIGYDRSAEDTASNGGTPGYANDAVKDKIMDGTTVVFNGTITFSEIMLSLGEGRQNLPQWIELYNSSMTQAVNLNGWKLHIENYTDVDTALDAVLTLGDMEIAPNQTVLIVTNTGRVSDPDHFPSNRVLNLWTNKGLRDALEMVKRTDQVFSSTGFNFELVDPKGNSVDEAGNLDGNRRTRDELDSTWAIPMNGDDGRRSSLIRVYDKRTGAVDGTMAEAWVLADATDLAFAIAQTYYGDPDDFGTPGFRGGGPLPVSLSKFRPERLKDTGEIVVRWVTESELNNAGFNILRSDKRDGEFTKVHFEAGQGTTSERTAYEWSDTSAKPNVVYYYQIQDVSLDGGVTTLQTTHLRGNVTVVGKATTTWGDIKALQ
jgi:hypothetical protein